MLAAGLAINLALTAALPVAAVFADSWQLGDNLVLARTSGRADLSRHAAEVARANGLDTLVADNRAMLADFFYTLRDSGLAHLRGRRQGFPPAPLRPEAPAAARPGRRALHRRADAPAVPRHPRRPRGSRPLAAGPGLPHRRRPRLPRARRCWIPEAGRTAMAVHVRHPFLLSAAPSPPGALTFSLLYFLESLSRATLVTVLPLTAYGLFGSKETVSLVYTLGVARRPRLQLRHPVPRPPAQPPLDLHPRLRASRRSTPPSSRSTPRRCSVAGMFCRTAGAALLNVTLSLYIMDNIGKRELTRSEPLRLAIATLAWGVAPYLGVRLMQGVGLWAPCALSLAAALVLAAVFWVLRLAEGSPDPRPAAPAPPMRTRSPPSAASSPSRACASPGRSPSPARRSGSPSSSTSRS